MSKLSKLLTQFNKDHDAEIIRVGIDRSDPARLASGIFPLDLALGGGIPIGRVTVVFGPESSMKTTLCFKWLAEAQRRWPERRAVAIDLEGTFSTSWARRMGVNTDTLVYAKPANAEQAVDLIEALLHEADDVSFIMLDSLAAMVTQKELASAAEDAMVGVQGILINKLYRKLTQAMAKVDSDKGFCPTVVFVNQIRYKIGVLHGDPETQPGGPSFRFAASLALRLYGKDEYLKELSKTLPAYKKVSVTVKKWKIPITARNIEFALALLPNPKLKLAVGDAYSMSTIMQYLKHYELLTKAAKTGWVLHDEHGEILMEMKTQDALETKMREDEVFGQTVRDLIVRVVLERGDSIEAD